MGASQTHPLPRREGVEETEQAIFLNKPQLKETEWAFKLSGLRAFLSFVLYPSFSLNSLAFNLCTTNQSGVIFTGRSRESSAGGWELALCFSNESSTASPNVLSERRDLEVPQVLPTHLQVPALTLWLGDLAVEDTVNIKEYLNSK